MNTKYTIQHIKTWLNLSVVEDVVVLEYDDLDYIAEYIAEDLNRLKSKSKAKPVYFIQDMITYLERKMGTWTEEQLLEDPFPQESNYKLQLLWATDYMTIHNYLPSFHEGGFDRAEGKHPIYGEFCIVGYKIHYLNLSLEQPELIHHVGTWDLLRLNRNWVTIQNLNHLQNH